MKRWIDFALKAGVSVGILALIGAKTDVAKIRALLASVGGEAVAVTAALMIVQKVVQTYRWILVMRGVDVRIAFWPALQALYVSLPLGQCMPSFIGGDAYRVYWVFQAGNGLARAVRGVLIDRLSALIALVVMMAASVPFLFARFAEHALRIGMLTVLAGGCLATAMFFTGDLLPRRWRRLKLVNELAELSAAARRVVFTGTTGLLLGPLAIFLHVITMVVMFVWADSLHVPLSMRDCVLIVPPVMLVTAMPISIAGWGVREGAMVGALSFLGIGREPALALSVLMGFSQLANALIGLVPLIVGWEQFVAVRAQVMQPSMVERARRQ